MSRASCSNLIISDYYCNVCVKTTNVTAACSSAATGWQCPAAETAVSYSFCFEIRKYFLKFASCLVQSAVTNIEGWYVMIMM